MKSFFIYLWILGGVVLYSACEDFLSELPAKGANQPVKDIEQLIGLLNDPKVREFDAAGAFMTDDTEFPTALYDAAYTYFSEAETFYYYTFDTDKIALSLSDPLWQPLYETIYNANLILENIDKVNGDSREKEQVKAEAHFLRAYSYWRLTNQYCLPYCEKNLKEPGLPLRKTTDMEESLGRATLEETYRFIDEDLLEALKVNMVTTDQSWRVSQATIQAFLSRYYLFRGEYEKAVTAATAALANAGTVKLKDYNTLGSVPMIPGVVEFPEMALYSENMTISWPEFFYARTSANMKLWYVPSSSLIACYDDKENDLRYKLLFSYGSSFFALGNMVGLGYNFFYMVTPQIPSGVTIQEVMLNKAEALLRQANPDKAEALELLDELRRHRFATTAGDVSVKAATNEEALRFVLSERRRELPFTHRWFDIRRFAVNETVWDDVKVERSFYGIVNGAIDKSRTEIYTLPVGSRRYALPINENDISASRGVIQQNTY